MCDVCTDFPPCILPLHNVSSFNFSHVVGPYYRNLATSAATCSVHLGSLNIMHSCLLTVVLTAKKCVVLKIWQFKTFNPQQIKIPSFTRNYNMGHMWEINVIIPRSPYINDTIFTAHDIKGHIKVVKFYIQPKCIPHCIAYRLMLLLLPMFPNVTMLKTIYK